MARIIAGSHGGRTIAVPAKGTRPTTDRVREALFGRLDHHDLLDGAHVLDLYAGSGALGLEAASRGAERVVLVEAARTAAQVCRDNVASLGLRDVVTVVDRKAESYLAHPAAPSAPFTLAFVDPPYDLGESELAAVLEALVDHLSSDDAVVVVERSSRSPEPVLPPGLALWETRKYGETALHLLEVPAHDHPQA
ncbi:16S rRNA (guanine(966)-N(2))-methyltransferase RsmD [Serinibacter arcticus]|uniref:16S rRNA (Guanine(966)-N(2))-methyltransferase RsmD n=1 Tax=Serinibacter arcticus TaxID=1655435 RepID=A0A2U1ZR04_9MICO|nr:16S rRNA (guanine(966)-N(2))-methyltransferase RsmD [Serinibacter arcticus]PWD49408.1 16S rRNA (guanine(966)-N(2))-methyltransferase RsmD [Serinibacter arcticus]